MKFFKFLISPIPSLYSPSFYKAKLNESLKYGFLYLIYMAVIGACSILIILQLRAIPIFNEFIDWFAKEMPEVTLSQGRISSAVTQPYLMNHPRFGNILILDTSKESLKPGEIGRTAVYITGSLIYLYNPIQNETETIDLMQFYETAKKKGSLIQDEIVNSESIRRMYAQIKPVLSVLIFFGALFYLFMWKLGAAFLYSVIAVIFNLFREKKYPYPALLNVTIYAMTAVSVLQLSSLLTQNLRLNVQSWIAAGITTAYLALTFFVALPPDEFGNRPDRSNLSAE